MKQIRSQLDKIIELLLVSILSAMVINVLWQIITRYFSASPSSFSDELARYLMIWLGLIGSAYVSGKKEHVSIDYFLKKLNHKKRVLLNRLIDFIILFFAFCNDNWRRPLSFRYYKIRTTVALVTNSTGVCVFCYSS